MATDSDRPIKHRPSVLVYIRQVSHTGFQAITWSLLLSHLTWAPYAVAGPSGGQIVGGNGQINQSGLTTNITQNSSQLAIDWASYNLNSNEIVNYIQPGSSSIALNRILSNSASQIHGRINANGRVILVNPNGILFSPTATLNVGGLIASGLDINPSDFMNGEYVFNEVLGSDGFVINSGTINAASGGSVALLGRQVENQGMISAKLGSIALAAGKEAVVTFDRNGLMGVRVSQAILQDELGVDPAVLNSGDINAEGGRILMSGSVSQDIFSQAVNRGELEQAASVVVAEDGSFTLGAGADVVNTGQVSVSTDEGQAGQVVMLGENLTNSGEIHADVQFGEAGQIELHAQDTTRLTEQSETTAIALQSGSGGDIKLLGEKVGLFDESRVDASGVHGGGEVYIGGDREGQNARVRNAEFIYLGEQTSVAVDALEQGDAGKLIAFANDTARIHGGLYARGGVRGGNGGFIETSGLRGFEITNSPDVSAISGSGGTWLIDPYNITIVAAGTGTTGVNTVGDPFSANAIGAQLDVGLIQTALQGDNATVVVKTNESTDTGTSPADITLDTVVNYDGANNGTLSLQATGNIYFTLNQRIEDLGSGDGNSLNLDLNANGDVNFSAGVFIQTRGGAFRVDDISADATLTNFTNNGIIDTAGGDVDIDIGGTVTLNASSLITTGGGAFTAGNATTNITSFSNLGTVDTTGLENVDGGAISITSAGAVSSTGFTSVGGDTGTSGSGAPNRAGRTGGDVTIVGSSIDITGSIDASGSDGVFDTSASGDNGEAGGNGGQVDLTAITGDIDVNSINTSGGAAAGDYTGTSIDTANGGDAATVTLTTSATGAIGLQGDIDSSGGVGYITTGTRHGNGAAVTFNGDVTLAAGITIDASGASDRSVDLPGNNANVTFAGTVNGTTANGQRLNILGDDINFGGNLGSGMRLGDIDITATGAIDATGFNFFANSLTVNSSTSFIAQDISLVALGASPGGNLTINSGVVEVGNITTSGVNADTFSIAVTEQGGIAPSITLNGDIDADASGTQEAADLFFTSATTAQLNINHTTNFTSAVNVFGSSATDTITMGNRANAWVVDGADTVTLNTNVMLTDVEHLVGGDDVDVFTLTTSVGETFVGSFDGGGGNNQLINQRSTVTDNWEINAVNSGRVTGVDNGSNNSFQNIQTLVGGNADDTFSITGTGDVSGSINGGGGTNTLVGFNDINNWDISGANQGSVEHVASFINIHNLTGNNAADNFTFSTLISAISGDINGGGGTNSITGRDTLTDWLIDDVNSGSTAYITSFANIQDLTGGTNNDLFTLSATGGLSGSINGGGGVNSLTGRDSSNVWTISTANGGSVTNVTNGFSNIQNLFGGDLDDTFILQVGGSLSGNIDGNLDVDTLVGADVVNAWNINAADSGSVTGVSGIFLEIENLDGGSAVDTFTLSGTGSISGTIDGGGGAAVDILVGRDVFNEWAISGADQGVLSSVDVIPQVYVGFFQDIEQLNGGASNDVFRLTDPGSSVSGGVNGFNGTNTLVGRSTNTTWQIDALNSGSSDHVASFSNIQTLTGNVADDDFVFSATGALSGGIVGGGGAGSNSILARDGVTNTWVINALDEGSLNGMVFSQIGILLGGSGDDNFSVTTTSGMLSGRIDGGLGQNTLSHTNSANNTWTISAANAGSMSNSAGVLDFSFIQNLNGGTGGDGFVLSGTGSLTGNIDGGAGNNSLTGRADTANFWAISVANGGMATNVGGFSNIGTLIGGDQDDSFVLSGSGSLTGTVDGGLGTNNSFTANNTLNTWSITGVDQGTVTNTAGFSNIQNITGGTGIDNITFADANARITGTIDGSTGIDLLDISALDNEVTVQLGAETSVAPNPIVMLVSNIETLRANSDPSLNNQLVGESIASTWTISGTNSGSVAPTIGANAENTVNFENFSELQGGNASDTFSVTGSGVIDRIDGGGAADTLDFSTQTGQVVVDLGAGLNFTIRRVEQVRGNGTDSTIVGANADNIWSIVNSNTGIIGGLTFIDFTQILGNDGIDVLNVTYDGALNGGMIFNGAGGVSDAINLSGGSSIYTGAYTPDILIDGNLHDGLAYTSNANTYGVTYRNTEIISDNVQSQSLTVNGTSGSDTFNLGSGTVAADTYFSVNGNTQVRFGNTAHAQLIINGATDDIFTLAQNVNLGTSDIIIRAGTLNGSATNLLAADQLTIESLTNDMVGDRLRTDVNVLNVTDPSTLIRIDEQNDVQLGTLVADSLLDLVAAGNVTAGPLALTNSLTVNSTGGNIDFSNAANALSGELLLSAANGLISISNSVNTQLGAVTAQDLTVNSTGSITDASGAINVTGMTTLNSTTDIVLDNNNDLNQVTVGSANNVSLNDTNVIELTSINAGSSANVTANGIQLGVVSAPAVSLDAGSGNIADINNASLNVSGTTVSMRATTGIGSTDTIETAAAELDVINSTSGVVMLNNTGPVLLTNLMNNGDIQFTNDVNVTIDNIDAGFTVGRLTLEVINGSVYGVDRSPDDFTQIPDITADSAFVTVSDEFGTFQRPIVLELNSEFFLAAVFSSTYFYGGEPPIVQNTADLQVSVFDSINSVSGQQLIEVESIADIDPAIFTGIRNYNVDDVSIRLPVDQLYEDELDRQAQ